MSQTSTPTSPDLLARPRRAINFRSLTIGTLAITVVCGLTTYNDHVVANTFFTGSYLPLALVLLLFLLVVVCNASLRRFRPSSAFSSAELSIIVLMTVIGTSLASQGFLRFFIPNLVTPFREASANAKFWEVFKSAGLPDWLFPVPSVAQGVNHPVINTFFGRVQPGEPVPFGAWLRPIAGWSFFFLAWFTCLISIVWIFRRQWSVNERLPFPIASIEAALIAEPRPGRLLNDLLGSRLFWTGVMIVFCWQSLVVLNRYFPRTVPLVPIRYNLSSIMANEPWSYFSPYVKSATVYFTFLGIAYFIQSRISFSLWASFLVAQVITVQSRMYQSDISYDAWHDQKLGASLAFTAGFLWIGRHHLAAVARQLIGRKGGTSLTREENYRWPAVLFLCGAGGMVAWLMLLQVQWWVALGIAGLMLISHMVTARVVAETGLPFIRYEITAHQIYFNFPTKWFNARDLFFTAVAGSVGPISTRESVGTLAQHGLVVADNSGVDTGKNLRSVALVMVWAFVVATSVATVASLWTHYRYATPIAIRVQHQVIDPPAMDRPRAEMVDPMVRFAEGKFPARAHSPALHISTGAAVTGVLQLLSLRSAAWPFLPVGYLLCSTWYVGLAWFSLMLGWLAKLIILKYGGAGMYQQARPLFVGAIFGEALAAGVWMLISLALAWAGYDYQAIPMLPT